MSAPFEWSLADSEVSAITVDTGALTLAFSAAAVRRGDEAGYVRRLRLRLRGVSQVQGTEAIGRIREGRLWVAGRIVGAPLVPGDPAGPVRLELVFQNGVPFVAEAASMDLYFDGDPGFVLSYAC